MTKSLKFMLAKAIPHVLSCANIVDYDEVIRNLGDDADAIKLFQMHIWNPGRYMRFKHGAIICVSVEVK